MIGSVGEISPQYIYIYINIYIYIYTYIYTYIYIPFVSTLRISRDPAMEGALNLFFRRGVLVLKIASDFEGVFGYLG